MLGTFFAAHKVLSSVLLVGSLFGLAVLCNGYQLKQLEKLRKEDPKEYNRYVRNMKYKNRGTENESFWQNISYVDKNGNYTGELNKYDF